MLSTNVYINQYMKQCPSPQKKKKKKEQSGEGSPTAETTWKQCEAACSSTSPNHILTSATAASVTHLNTNREFIADLQQTVSEDLTSRQIHPQSPHSLECHFRAVPEVEVG